MIIYIILTRLSFSLAITASINKVVSQTDLKEGDTLNVAVALSLEVRDTFECFEFLLNGISIAKDDGYDFYIRTYALNIFGDRISHNKSGYSYELSIASLRINESMILRIELFYNQNGESVNVFKEISITVNG